MDVGISHLQTAFKCTKRCVKLHKIAHETPQNRLRLTIPKPLVGWGGDTHISLPSTPLSAVVGGWRDMCMDGKMGTPIFETWLRPCYYIVINIYNTVSVK